MPTPNTMSYYAVDREPELWDNSEAKCEVWVQDTGESGFEPQLTATFTYYGDAVMFAYMKNHEPELTSCCVPCGDGSMHSQAIVVCTGQIIADFSTPSGLFDWHSREFPLYAAMHLNDIPVVPA